MPALPLINSILRLCCKISSRCAQMSKIRRGKWSYQADLYGSADERSGEGETENPSPKTKAAFLTTPGISTVTRGRVVARRT